MRPPRTDSRTSASASEAFSGSQTLRQREALVVAAFVNRRAALGRDLRSGGSGCLGVPSGVAGGVAGSGGWASMGRRGTSFPPKGSPRGKTSLISLTAFPRSVLMRRGLTALNASEGGRNASDTPRCRCRCGCRGHRSRYGVGCRRRINHLSEHDHAQHDESKHDDTEAASVSEHGIRRVELKRRRLHPFGESVDAAGWAATGSTAHPGRTCSMWTWTQNCASDRRVPGAARSVFQAASLSVHLKKGKPKRESAAGIFPRDDPSCGAGSGMTLTGGR